MYGHIKLPYECVIDSNQFITSEFVKSLNTSLIVVIGDNDKVVDPNDSQLV